MSAEPNTESEAKREPCHFCGGDTRGGKPYELTLMNRERREEMHVKIPRCSQCAKRHQGWILLVGVGIVLAAVGFRMQKTFEDAAAVRAVFIFIGVIGLALCFGSQKLWQIFLRRKGPEALESFGQQHDMVQNALADGFVVGQLKRNEDGSLAE